MTNSDVLWVNLANALLGLATLVCIAAVVWGVVVEVAERAKAKARIEGRDSHTFALPELGLTMADGGRREDERDEEDES